MSKKTSVPSVETNKVSRRLFEEPTPYSSKPSRKTRLLVLLSDDSGQSVVESRCIEDEMTKQVELDFNEATLSSLVSKGVKPKALDMIDSSKLGVDEGIDRLANTLISNSSKYVVVPNSEPSK